MTLNGGKTVFLFEDKNRTRLDMSGLFKIHWGTLGSKCCSSFDILRDMKKQNVTAVKNAEKTQ